MTKPLDHNTKISRKILRDLALLGETSDDIAASLKARNIKGHTYDGFGCPITNYLKTKNDEPSLDLSTTMDQVMFYSSSRKLDIACELPTPVRDFVLRFDSGFYPELKDNF